MVTKNAPGHKSDPHERDIELSLSPGCFVGDRACTSFVSELEETATTIKPLIKSTPADFPHV